MRPTLSKLIAACALFGAFAFGQEGPYKIVKTAKVGGLGNFDYIYADEAGRKLYIPRKATQGTDGAPARVSVYDLDTLAPVGEIPGVSANGAVVDAKSGHGFAGSKPITMWDSKTLAVIKKIDVDPKIAPDGILDDAFNQRVYIFSRQTGEAVVIDAKEGTVLGTLEFGGAPEEAVSDGKGHVYVVIADKANIAVIDAKAMKVTTHYDFTGKGDRCNGLALDGKTHVLFTACGQGADAGTPQPTMLMINAQNGKFITSLPLAGNSDGAAFNPATKEAFSTHSNGTLTVVKEKSATSFAVEQNLQTMNGAKTLTLDGKTGRILTMAAEFGPAPANDGKGGGKGGDKKGPGRGQVKPDTFTILAIGK